MNNDEVGMLSERAAALRRSFDQAFAAAPASDDAAATQAFLAIGVGGDNYALRLSEISELFADKKVIPLPSQAADLLGIASFRGVLVAVYDLRILLGYPAGAPPRWLALVADDMNMPFGLAFDQLDGYLDVLPEAVAPAQATEHTRQHLAETVTAAGSGRPVVSVSSILETIRQRTQSNRPHAGV